MLIGLLLLTLFASHLYTSYRLWRAEAEVRRLREMAGQLVVEDPGRIHVLPLELQEPLAWRWRIYLPEGREYELHMAKNRIPAEGVHGGSGRLSFSPGEYELTARVQRDERGRWMLGVYYDQGALSSPFGDDQAAWLEKPVGRSTNGITASVRRRAVKTFSVDEPVVLVRVRAHKPTPGGGSTSHNDPAQGVMLWIAPAE